MSIRITVALDLAASVYESVTVLSGCDRVHHYRDITARGILHSDRDRNSARHKAVLLIFNRTCTDSNITEKVIKIAVILGVEHLVCGAEACLSKCAHMEISHCDDTALEVRIACRVGLVKHTLVAVARCSGLTCIDTRHDEYLILNLILYIFKAVDIIEYAVLIVSRAWTDDEEKFVRAVVEYSLYLIVTLSLCVNKLL